MPCDDVLDIDGERLLLIGTRVVLLSPVASVVHALLPTDRWLGLADLIAHIERAMPLPKAPDETVRGLLEGLAAEGVVAVTVV